MPGCFTIEINNIKILENDGTIPNSFFGKVEYQWMNIKDFSELKCQNASNNGCGGYGNNWFVDIFYLKNYPLGVCDVISISLSKRELL